MKKYIIMACMLVTCFAIAHAQSSGPDPAQSNPRITPPSPNAATLGVYGDVPVGLYTGIPNVDIPLYEVKLNKLTLPISVSYHSQGLKVEEKAGNIGLSWALNAGGVITRTVRGLPDENGNGYFTNGNTTLTQLQQSYDLFNQAATAKVDLQPDMFYYNFGGRSGKFVMDATTAHATHLIPDQALKIVATDNVLTAFNVTDEQGNVYVFDAKEQTTDDNYPPNIITYTSAWYLTKIITSSGEIDFTYADDNTSTGQYTESQYLNSSPDASTIAFNPGWHRMYSTFTITTKLLTQITTPHEIITFSNANDRVDGAGQYRITGFSVTDTHSNFVKKVTFAESYFGSDLTTPDNCRLKLDSVTERSATNAPVKQYAFDYYSTDQVPSIRSFAQDYWGYYNGKSSNTSLLTFVDPTIYGAYIANQATFFADRNPDSNFTKTGCLKKVTYPTGGSSSFVYEQNDYSNVNGAPVNEQQHVPASVNVYTDNPTAPDTETFTIGGTTSQVVTLTTSGSYTGPPPVGDGPTIQLNLINPDHSRTTIVRIPLINSTNTTYPSLAPGNYELIASVDGSGQEVEAELDYYTLGPIIHVLQTGGVRIKQVQSLDPVTLQVNNKFYGYKSPSDPTLSTGVLASDYNLLEDDTSPFYSTSWLVRNGSSTLYLGSTQGSHIGYAEVTEWQDTTVTGKKESYFISSVDYNNTDVDTWQYAPGTTPTNGSLISVSGDFQQKFLKDYDVTRGYLTKEIYYNTARNKVKEIDNSYNLPDALNPTAPNYFELADKPTVLHHLCTQVCNNCVSGGGLTCNPATIDVVYVWDNKIICPWIYKTQTLETDYDVNGLSPVATTTNYYYDNPSHQQLTRSVVTESNGKVLTYSTSYAGDYVSGTPFLDDMITAHEIGLPIEQVTYQDYASATTILSGTITQYQTGGNAFIDKILNWESAIAQPLSGFKFSNRVTGQLPTGPTSTAYSPDSRYQLRLTFNQYDAVGNPLTITPTDGPSSAYQWGYNKNYPIAEAKNATSAEIFFEGFEESTISGVQTTGGHTGHNYLSTSGYTTGFTIPDARSYVISYWSNAGSGWIFSGLLPYTGQTLTGNIDDVRIYPADAEMASYTYDPLIGMTSASDAKSEATYYEYDSFKRLMNEKDLYHNITKSINYHYYNQPGSAGHTPTPGRGTSVLSSPNTLGSYFNYNNGSIRLTNGFTSVPTTGQSFHAYIINSECIPIGLNLTNSQNYVLTSVPRIAGLTDTSKLNSRTTCQLMQTVQYVDGLGRQLQNIQVEGSANGADVVQAFAYDQFGREPLKYLPYAANTYNGSYKPTALTTALDSFYTTPPAGVSVNAYPQAGTGFETSMLNRVVEQGAPGAPWQLSTSGVSGSGHTIKQDNGANASADVPLWLASSGGAAWGSTYYSAGALYADTTTDENGHLTITYTDKLKRMVCKRVQNGSTYLATNYIYDDLNNLAYVVPPIPTGTTYPTSFVESDPVFNNFMYGYHYDERRRMIRKKIPGKGWQYMVYNLNDQLVASQDSNQYNRDQWIFTKYDAQNRMIQTGIYTYAIDQADLQTLVNTYTTTWESAQNSGNGYTNIIWPTTNVTTTLILNYYDGYNLIPNLPSNYSMPSGVSTRTTGLLTATLTNVLNTPDSLWKAHYYDAKGRDTVTYAQHYLNGIANSNNYDKVATSYNFTNQDSTTVRQHYVNSSGTPSLAVTIINNYTYDHVGRKAQTLEQINGGTNVLLSQIKYNEIGQAMTKQLNSTNSGASFSQNVAYTYNERGWLTSSAAPLFTMTLNYNDGTLPQYNGNIANQTWSSSASSGSYIYRYDPLNRLVSGIANTGNTEKSIVYDEMGNITGLRRYLAGTIIDELKYDYTHSGNQTTQLQTITDSTTNDAGLKHGTFTYAYDGNGNMVTDNSKSLTSTYNIINLPNVNTLSGGTVSYVYDATGNKLRRTSTVGTTTTTDYVSGIQYTNSVIDFIQTETGRALNSSGTYAYQYNLTDNLGNARLSFNNNGAIIQQDDYLPFGYDITVGTPANPKNQYLYNGKELQTDLGLYDYGARLYDPIIGRWTSVDPLAEKSRRFSPYNYVVDNPVRFIDPDGMDVGDSEGSEGTIIREPGAITAFVNDLKQHAHQQGAKAAAPCDPCLPGQDPKTATASIDDLPVDGNGVKSAGQLKGVTINGRVQEAEEKADKLDIATKANAAVGTAGLGATFGPALTTTTTTLGKFGEFVGYAGPIVGGYIDYKGYQLYKANPSAPGAVSPRKFGVDIGIGSIGMIPVIAPFSATYFAIDAIYPGGFGPASKAYNGLLNRVSGGKGSVNFGMQ